jgi:hypothetical protein
MERPKYRPKIPVFPSRSGKEPCISLEIQRFQAVVNTLNALSPFDKKYLHRLMNQKPKFKIQKSKIKIQNSKIKIQRYRKVNRSS